MSLEIIILAAGKGSRMRSTLPKVMHEIAGKSMLMHVIETAQQLNPIKIHVIVGFLRDMLIKEYHHLHVNWIVQEEQLGTGHAVSMALPHIQKENQILILYGDTPLISTETLTMMLKSSTQQQTILLTAIQPNPFGYGRIIRNNDNNVIKIIEEKDLMLEQKKITEINTGVILSNAHLLSQYLPLIKNNNQQQEYYLTDFIEMVARDNTLKTLQSQDYMETQGVNDKVQLSTLEKYYQQKQRHQLMQQGVTLLHEDSLIIRGNISVGEDVIIDINVILEGRVKIGSHITIGAGSILKDCIIEDNTTIQPYSIIDTATIKQHCTIGPFARIRPETTLHQQVKIGNFVEIKKSTIQKNSKINHLSYVGDTTMGAEVNIGAGVITCNYDGKQKHNTTIDNNAFIGSNSTLIAPITIKNSATIAAGTVITQDVEEKSLAIARVKQKNIPRWKKK